jgi:cytidyltransferase-like protein
MRPSYGSKILTVEQCADAIGRRPRERSVIMCHGAFDIVHPGHLRHLMYAKEKADVLVASITTDEYITKAEHRPFVPQELRAHSLAALEMVDYVIVDPNPTPIQTIRRLQPDYFAKGYEYFANGVPPKTQEEMDTLAEYGGEMVFTPGDVVYSSSALIEASPPQLGLEKLLALLDSEGLHLDDLRRVVRSLSGLRIHVIGDTIVDSYSYCSLLGATAKSPTFSVKHDSTERFCGGAAVVAKHMRMAGANVTLSTVLGNDELRGFVELDMAQSGIHCIPVVDPTRTTTHKERFIADGYKLLQVDRVDNGTISDRVLGKLCEQVRNTPTDLVVFSDFRHGIFNRQTIGTLKQAIPPNAKKAADSQVSNRWGNIRTSPISTC